MPMQTKWLYWIEVILPCQRKYLKQMSDAQIY